MCVQLLEAFLPACVESRKTSWMLSRVDSLLHGSMSWLLSCDTMRAENMSEWSLTFSVRDSW